MPLDQINSDQFKNRYNPEITPVIVTASKVSNDELFRFSNYITSIKESSPDMSSSMTEIYLEYSKITKEIEEKGLSPYRETALKTYSEMIRDHLAKINTNAIH